MSPFQLDDEPWLPVVYLDGAARHVSLRTLFMDAHQITGITMRSPAGQASLLRILTAVTYRVTGLGDSTVPAPAWYDQRDTALANGAFDSVAVGGYLARWHDRFDLFSPSRPWRQDPRLRDQCREPSGLNKIILGRPAGNNATLFSPYHDANPGSASIADAVESMLVRQFYGSLGRCSARTPSGGTTSANFTYLGPLRGRISYHPTAPTLFGTLIAHLVPPMNYPFPTSGRDDLAEWETPQLHDPLGRKPVPAGIVSLLANDSGHDVLLDASTAEADGEVQVGDGWLSWRYQDKGVGGTVGFDPFLSYRHDPKRGRIARLADESRDLWRDLPAILPATGGAGIGDSYGQPAAIAALAEFQAAFVQHVRVAGFGFAQHGFQPTDREWQASLTPAVFLALAKQPAAIDPTAHRYPAAIADWVMTAEAEADVLRKALYTALRDAHDLDPKGNAVQAWARLGAPRFWQAAHAAFTDALETAVDGAAFEASGHTASLVLRRIVVDIYDSLTASAREARALQAIVRHRPRPLPARAASIGHSGGPHLDPVTDFMEISA